MTDAARTHLEMISPRVEVAAYTDGDVVIHACDDGGVVYEPAQLRVLRTVLGRLTDKESITSSLGENCLDEEGYIEWDGSTVHLSDGSASDCVTLSESEAIELEKSLSELGY